MGTRTVRIGYHGAGLGPTEQTYSSVSAIFGHETEEDADLYGSATVVQTCGRYSYAMIADTVGISGWRNRGAAKTKVPARSWDEIVVCLTSSKSSNDDFGVSMFARLDLRSAKTLMSKLRQAISDVEGAEE